MDEQRKYAILFAATILAARKLSDPDLKAWPRAAAISDAISKANQILEMIDERWPTTESAALPHENKTPMNTAISERPR